MELREKTIVIDENEFLIVPKGIDRRPVGEHEDWIMLFEPAATLKRGDAQSDLTEIQIGRI